METKIRTFPGLSGNQLKLLALITMTLDHIGLQLFPQVEILRILGRLALPIFAYMIAEGCHYTRSRTRYLAAMAAMALVCQIVYFFAMGSLYQCILVTFSLSIALIYLTDHAIRSQSAAAWLAALLGIGAAYFLSNVLPGLLPGTGYGIDYRFAGIVLPVLIYLGRTKREKLLLTALGLVLLALQSGTRQWFALLALLPLALYSGKRGRRNMKYLFYIYYPAHLVVIWLLGYLF